MNRYFSDEEVQMANMHMKKCSKFMTIRIKQIKAISRCHLISKRMATMKKANNNKC